MNWIIVSLLISLGGGWLFGSLTIHSIDMVYAETPADLGDCGNFIRIPERAGYQRYNAIYPQTLFETAQKNLWNYCCTVFPEQTQAKNIQLWQFCQDPKNKVSQFTHSPYLYDHLIDLGFRYLDGVSSNQYNGAPLDSQGLLWRETIEEVGTNPNGAIPLDILNKYYKAWGDANFDLGITESLIESCRDAEPRLAAINANWNQINLTQKYYTICEISSCLAKNAKDMSLLNSCHSLTRERIQQENQFVQNTITLQGNNQIDTIFNAYARYTINQIKFDKLLEKFVMMAKGFNFVDNKVSEFTRVCSA